MVTLRIGPPLIVVAYFACKRSDSTAATKGPAKPFSRAPQRRKVTENRREGHVHRKSILFLSVVTAAAAFAGAASIPARADTTIIDDWYKAKLPAPPQLKPVTLDAKTTALLVMDFTVQTCTQARRPRCAASVPKVKK